MPPEMRSSARILLRAAVNSLAILLAAPCWVPARLEAALTGGEGWFVAAAQLLSLFPDQTSIPARATRTRGPARLQTGRTADEVGGR